MLMYPKGYWWNHGFNMSLSGRAFYDVSLDPELKSTTTPSIISARTPGR